MGAARWGCSAAMMGGKVYIMGEIGSGGSRLSSVECFDLATGAWEVVAPMGTARFYGCSVST